MAKNDITAKILYDATQAKAQLKELDAGSQVTFGSMGQRLQAFAAKIPGASALMDKFGVSGSVAGLAVAGGLSVVADKVVSFVGGAVSGFESAAQAVLKFKEITGVAADEASRFVAVGEKFGVSGDELSSAVAKLNKNLELTPKHLEALGVSIAHTASGGIDVQQTFLNVVAAYNATDDAGKKAAIGAQAFGKAWQGMAKLLDAGATTVQQSFDQVAKTKVFSDEDLAKAEQYRIAMFNLNVAVDGVKRQIAEGLIPALTLGAEALGKMLSQQGSGGGGVFGWLTNIKVGVHALVTEWAPWLDQIKTSTTAQQAQATSTFELTSLMGQAARAQQGLTAAQANTLPVLEMYSQGNAQMRQGIQEVQQAETSWAAFTGLQEHFKEVGDKALEAGRKLQTYLDNVNLVEGNELSVEHATNNLKDAMDAQAAAMVAHADKTHTAVDVQKAYRDAVLASKDAIIAHANAEATYAANQALATGSTDSAAAANRAQRLSLIATFQTMSPADPNFHWLKDYIDALYSIPINIGTNVNAIPLPSRLGGPPAAPRLPPRPGPKALAEGGIVPARPGGTLALLAEAGHAEAVVPLDGKHAAGNVTNVYIDASGMIGDRPAIERWLASTLANYFRRNGNVVASF